MVRVLTESATTPAVRWAGLHDVARGEVVVIEAFDPSVEGLGLGGHRLVVGDVLRVRRRGNPIVVELCDAAGDRGVRSVRLGLCSRTARGVMVRATGERA
ncbi:MAG: hypothetical protein AAFR38_08850 [Planctomycetota bacterium]